MTFATPVAVTLKTSQFRVVAGNYVTLRASSPARARVRVTVNAQPFGLSAFSQVTTVLTGGGGRVVQRPPNIQTTYQVSANGLSRSTTTTVGVQPAVMLRRITASASPPR
jgi:hypothetical protein